MSFENDPRDDAYNTDLMIDEIKKLQSQKQMLIDALKEISKGEGRYSLDPLTHADNCIHDMKYIACAALQIMEEPIE